VLAVAVVRAVPAETAHEPTPSMGAEFAGLRSSRLWLTLATCAAVNAGVLSIYSFIAPLLTERTGLQAWAIPVALVLFGAGALAGSVLGGRAGDTHPFGTPLTTAAIALVASIGLCLFSTLPVPTMVLFTLLGLVGLSANPVLVNLAVRYGGHAPTLASAMATSLFNLGTAVGTAITGAALATSLGPLAAPLVGVVFGVLVFLPLGTLTILEHRTRSRPTAMLQTR
jgi:DHA1 family chloramphenicol resistance protein-like MFS transporter